MTQTIRMKNKILFQISQLKAIFRPVSAVTRKRKNWKIVQMKTVPIFALLVLFAFVGVSFGWRTASPDDTWIANRIVNFKWDQNKDGSYCNFTGQMCGPLV
jgi:hypothetical protein